MDAPAPVRICVEMGADSLMARVLTLLSEQADRPLSAKAIRRRLGAEGAEGAGGGAAVPKSEINRALYAMEGPLAVSVPNPEGGAPAWRLAEGVAVREVRGDPDLG